MVRVKCSPRAYPSGVQTIILRHFAKKKIQFSKKKPYQAQKTDLGFFHTNPPIFHKTYFLYGGQNTISDDLLEVETQKYAFRLILGWGIQKWNPFFDILKI